MKKYKIIALIGEAGTGKDTLMKSILKSSPNNFNEIISCTTRPMREGESNGINYYYLTPEEFTYKILNHEMLETTKFNDWFYGTSINSLKPNALNIGVFNPNGIRTLLLNSELVEIIVFKINCSDKIRLIRQLNREKNPDIEEIIRRYKTDKDDFSDLEFDYINIKNETKEDLELAKKLILSKL